MVDFNEFPKSTFHHQEPKKTVCSCGKEGRERFDNGLACGVHCDECWEDLLKDCRKRSW